ncbi:hypothetical protein [uncultured Wocania sp.]|uniref:hypothetical protein n=1 Tax=uncultured Wocania sp. TaxID=2834404 RepID=UPI0030F52CFD
MAILVLSFIVTYFIELLYRRIILDIQMKIEIKKFDANNEALSNLDLIGYKLGHTHIY